MFILLIFPSLVSATPIPPSPDIKINGLDGPLTITTEDVISASVALDPGDFSGYNADWWVFAETPGGVYSYSLAANDWLPGFFVTYQGPLTALRTYELTDINNPQIGPYTFHFAVDRKNGVFEECPFCDRVDVTVNPVPEPSTFISLLTGMGAVLGIITWRRSLRK